MQTEEILHGCNAKNNKKASVTDCLTLLKT